MSYLKDILVELENVVHDQHENGMPVVWSRDIQHKLSKNIDHWDKAGKPGGLHSSEEEEVEICSDCGGVRQSMHHEDIPTDQLCDCPRDEEQEDAGAFGLSKRGRDDEEDDFEREYGAGQRGMERRAIDDPNDPARDDYVGGGDYRGPEDQYAGGEYEDWDDEGGEPDISSFDRDMSDTTPFDDVDDPDAYEDEPEDEDEWDPSDDLFNAREPSTEFEEEPVARAPVSKWTEKFLAQAAKERGECPDCFGTGDQFPDMTTDCETCGGSGEIQDRAKTPVRFRDYVKQEEQEEDERLENPDETDPTNVAVDDQYGIDDPNDEVGLDKEDLMGASEETQEWDDPDYQGVIRTVPNAHLVYKRQQEDGSFDELWQYNIGGDFNDELDVRRGILAGTDIPINKMRSPDNTQSFELWTIGNGQLMQVRGLPN